MSERDPFVANAIARLKDAIDAAAAPIFDGLPSANHELSMNEGLRHLLRHLAQISLNCMELSDEYPQLMKVISLQRQHALPNADTLYRKAKLNGNYSYTVTGTRGTAKVFEFEIWHGVPGDLKRMKYFSHLDRFQTGPNGEVVIKLSREKQEGNWLEIPEGESALLTRDYFYDWDNEEASVLHIERDGATYPPPPLSRERVSDLFDQSLNWLHSLPGMVRVGVEEHLAAEPNTMPVKEIEYGFNKNTFCRGHYVCEEDEAVIIELTPPETVFWTFMLSNFQWEAMDFDVRQTSLNGHQARLDSDGVFRAVISHRDPGVANWLDAGGHTVAPITARYYNAVSKPIPVLKRVKFDDLNNHLPADTARVTPEERQVLLRRRRDSVVRRLFVD